MHNKCAEKAIEWEFSTILFVVWSDNKPQICTEFRVLQSMHLAWTVSYTLNFLDFHAYLPELDNHSKTCVQICNPHLSPLPSLAEFEPSQHRTKYSLE